MELERSYSERNLRSMRQFYLVFSNKIWQAVPAKLTWSHYLEIIYLHNFDEMNYYIMISEKQNLSYRELHIRIKNKEYERLDIDTKNKININMQEESIGDFIKNPILIKNSHNYELISEKVLKQLILEDIFNFMKELGEGFSLIDNEYKIKLGDRYNYIDLLLYNYKYNCFVVVKLKVTELRKEHIVQIEVYMNYINQNVKTINQDRTIGIIICKRDNYFVMEYCSDERIFNTTYEVVFE